jgi:hypothetical protein
MLLWGLDGVDSAPIEITVPVGKGPVPTGVVVHPTRRPIEPVLIEGIPVSAVERSILDGCALLAEELIELAYDRACRRGLTKPERVAEILNNEGHSGVPGRLKLIRILEGRKGDNPSGSPAEALALRLMRRAGDRGTGTSVRRRSA